MLKVILIVLLIAMAASLFTGLGFLFRDSDAPDSRRLLYALGVRISIGVTLLCVVGFGLYTGQLELGAPWHNQQP